MRWLRCKTEPTSKARREDLCVRRHTSRRSLQGEVFMTRQGGWNRVDQSVRRRLPDPPLPFGFAHSRDKRRARPSGWQKTLRRRLNATFARECQSVHSVVLARTTDGVRIVVECSDCSSVSVPDCIKGLRVSLSVASVLRTECVRSFPTLIRYLRSKNQVSYGPQPFGYPS